LPRSPPRSTLLPYTTLFRSAALLPWARLDRTGLGCAVLSGAIASGAGYAIWYTVLPALGRASAATVQLSVPVLAAAGGILFLGRSEEHTSELQSLRHLVCRL